MNRDSVFLFTGGSGGHVQPALILKRDLERKGSRVTLFISSFSHFKIELGVIKLNISKLKLLALLQLSYISMYILIVFILRKPRVVVGFGGYYSLAGIIIAKILRKKTFIYEPNMILGDTNRFLSHFVDRILVLWPKILLSPKLKLKVRVIRPLVKKDYSLKAKNKDETFTVLFTGGSSGSMFLNNLFLSIFKGNFLREQNIRAVLIAGESSYLKIKEAMDDLNLNSSINVELYSFRNDMDIFINEFDLIISRAGAQIIVESIFAEIPMLYIPYPYANKHQIYNARNISSKRCALSIKQELADKEAVSNIIKYFINNKASLNKIKSELKNIKHDLDGTDKAADIILR